MCVGGISRGEAVFRLTSQLVHSVSLNFQCPSKSLIMRFSVVVLSAVLATFLVMGASACSCNKDIQDLQAKVDEIEFAIISALENSESIVCLVQNDCSSGYVEVWSA